MDLAGETSHASELVSLAKSSESTMRLLRAGKSLGLRSWCIGAGAVRNLVWDHLHGFKEETKPEDVDLIFYDAGNLSRELEQLLKSRLAAAVPAVKWEVVNQASVHQWLGQSTGHTARPFQSLAEGIASWPEVATCVGLYLSATETIEVIAPHGLADLFDLVVRWNPERVPKEVYLERVARKRFSERWPKVKVLAC
jgi:uncharacterized protein